MDEIDPIKYLGDYPELPIDAPIGYPHILDLASMDEEFHAMQDISIADVVVTVLFKVMPAALTSFLDLDRPYFHYILSSYKNVYLAFCIKREGRTVTVRRSPFMLRRLVLTWI